jgi:RNA polymerase sigma-70 factor, ECF subfamily
MTRRSAEGLKVAQEKKFAFVEPNLDAERSSLDRMRVTIPHVLRVVAGTTVGEPTDAELVERALAGDTRAKELLFRRHIRAVSGTVIRLLGRRDGAEDIIQDTLTTALTELERLRDPQAFEAWVLQIAVRAIYRRLKKQRLLRFLGLDRGTDDATLATLANDDANQEHSAELALIDRVLAKLPAEQRLAWMLKYVEGESLERVAQILKCSLATAKRRIKAAQDRVEAHANIAKEAADA